MAKPKIPNQRNRYAKLRGRLNKYALAVQDIYDTLNREAARIAASTDFAGNGVFRFSDYPMTADAVNRLQGRFVREMQGLIYAGTSAEWKESNLVQDLLASKVLKTYGAQVSGQKTKVYYQSNSDALKAFQQRTEKGMNLSEKLWNQSGNYKQELEYAISSAVEKGTSAVTLSKRLSKYLNDFPSLKADYKEKFGQAVTCHDCEYRSIRLARTEINMAYRTAEQTRWKQMDFVVGYEVKTSYSHEEKDICDSAQGKYPKDFVFVGWHPNCMCYVIPILKTEDEFWADNSESIKSENVVTEVPDEFGKWIDGNYQRTLDAQERGTLPYWLKDNPDAMDCVNLIGKAHEVGDIVQAKAVAIAEECNGVVTPINYKGFKSMFRKLRDPNDPITINDIKDAVRNTIIVEQKDIDEVVSRLKGLDEFWRYKKQTPDKFCGYSGNIVNLSMPNGIKAEIQVNTPKMIFAKEKEADARRILGDKVWEDIAKKTGMKGGLGHEYYEQIRLLDNVKDAEKIAALTKKSKEYYSHFR